MRRDVLWEPLDAPGLEHLRLDIDEKTIRADGAIIAVLEEEAFRASYQITCDLDWRMRALRITASYPAASVLDLRADGDGHWFGETGEPLPALDGCIDVDFAATPFTNTLPIRRLSLQLGESAEIAVVYIDAPTLEVMPVRQHYTRLDADAGRYRFEALPYTALPDGFIAELSVDADGLVRDYSPLFRRVWSGER
jgi:hypothetical protein